MMRDVGQHLYGQRDMLQGFRFAHCLHVTAVQSACSMACWWRRISANSQWAGKNKEENSMARTRCLKVVTSSSVNVSALAMTGIKLTLVWSLRMNSMSIGFSL